MKTSEKIVRAIIYDLTDRRGLRQEWDTIDADIEKGIIKKWVEIAEAVMNGEERKIYELDKYY